MAKLTTKADKRCDRCGNILWNVTGIHIVIVKESGKRQVICGECFAKAGDTVIENARAK
jgi:hypothetical protein